ncbi:hypothetical protein [Eggerthella timonensis]|uniref:hypothetical protein n=1 Tax=Eggerthella timonensis TaxID=1871008 RepID=UPI000C7618BA|nr:hypothetical protein [Eggerthella timonensis]
MARPACRRAAGALLACAIALACLAGCAPAGASERTVEQRAAAELEEAARLDGPAFDAAAAALSARAGTERYGVDAAEFCRELLAGLSFEVRGADVDGARATVRVDVTRKSTDGALLSFAAAFAEYRGSGAFLSDTPEEAAERTGELILEAVREAPLETVAAELPFELEGGSWEPAQGYGEELSRVLAAPGGRNERTS